MSPLSIRPATLADISAITCIYADAVHHGTASFEISAPDEIEMARRMNELLVDRFPYVVAEYAGTVVGYAYAASFRSRLAFRPTVEDSVYVAIEMQRRGVGHALLTALISEAQARDFRQMIAVIGDPSNQSASIALHEVAGFHHVGVLECVGFKHGRWLDCLLMQRALGEGALSSPDSLLGSKENH